MQNFDIIKTRACIQAFRKWKGLRLELAQYVRDNKISQEDFRLLGIYEWQNVYDRALDICLHIYHHISRHKETLGRKRIWENNYNRRNADKR